MAKCDVMWYFLNLSVVFFVCNFGGVMAQEEEVVSCYGPGSIALSVILTLIIAGLIAVVLFLLWKKFIKPKKGQHLILETDPEKGKGEYAFDNPGFKDAGLTPVGKALEKNKVDSGNKTKWNQWSPLGVLTLKNEKKRTLDDSAIQDLHKIVTLRSHDFTGLGFNICGNMKEGIFIKDILHRGPAFESGKLNSGDRINSVTISFEHMVYEDALAILSYASPYEVIVSAKSGKAVNYPGQAGRPGHPIFRSSSTVDLSQVEKSSKKRLFQPDDSSEIGSNYSSLQKTRSNATTLERTKSKSPKPNQKLIKPKNKLNHDQLKMQLEQNIVEDYKETLRMKNDLETPQKAEIEHQKTENKHHKFGIQVLPMERSPKSAELSQNDNNINLEKSETTTTIIPVVGIDEVDKKVAPPVKKREKINKAPEVDTFTREDPLNGSGIKRDANNIPLEIPNNMLNAAMAARKNRKSVEEEDIKSPKKLKGKAPAPPGADDEASKFDEIYPVEENDAKLLIASKNLNKSDDSIEKIAKTDYNSDSDIETDNQSSVNTIELNASDITVHQSEENEEKQNRKTASTGDLTKIQKTRKTSTGTLERAQSLDITDTTLPALAAKKRKAGKIEDNFDSKTSSDDSLYGNALINKEPRLSLILDGLNTFQRSRLKKSTEWGNMEDAILNFKQQDGSSESVGRRSSDSYEDVKLSSENIAFNFDAKLPEFDALVNKIKEIKEESMVGDVKPVKNQIWPFSTSTDNSEYEIKSPNHNETIKVNKGDGSAITINKPVELGRRISQDYVNSIEMMKTPDSLAENVFGTNKIEVENKYEITKPAELEKIGISLNRTSEKFEIKFDDAKDFKHENSEANVRNTFEINKIHDIEIETNRVEPQIKLRAEKPEPPKRMFQSQPLDVQIQARPLVNDLNKAEAELSDIKIRSSKTILNEKISAPVLNEKSIDVTISKPEINEKVVITKPEFSENFSLNKHSINEKVSINKPERFVEIKTNTRESVVDINTKKPDDFIEISNSKHDRNVDINVNKTERFVEINKPEIKTNKMEIISGKVDNYVETQTNRVEKVLKSNTEKPDQFIDINISESGIKIAKPERMVEIKTNKPVDFVDAQINKSQSVDKLGMNINKTDYVEDININKHDRLVEIKTGKLDNFMEVKTKPEATIEISTQKPDRLVGMKLNKPENFVEINNQKRDTFVEIKTNKPDDAMAKRTNQPETNVENISEKSHHKPTIKHKIVKPDMSQVNSFILAERDATNKNLQPAIIKSDDTNVSDDIKVSRHSLGSLERAKAEKSDNVSNITIPSFESNVNKSKNVAESVKNFENIIVSTPDLIKNITIAEAIHDLNNEVTIEGPSSLTFEIPGGENLEEFKGHNGIKMKSNGDINKLEVSGDEKNSNSLTYITEIQVLTPKNVSEIEIIPKKEQPVKKNLDNDFESYIKNFESNIKNFETNIQSFEQNIQDVAETAKMDVTASTKSSVTVNEKVDAAKELQKVQEIVEEQLKKLPEMRFTTSSYESQIKPPEKRQSQIEILRSNFEKSTSPPRLGKSEPSPPKSRIPILNKTPPTSPERRDSKILDTEPDKEILEIMSSHIPMTSSLKYQPKTPTRNVTVTSIRSNSKIPSGLPTYNSRPPVPPRKTENEEIVQVSTNGNDSSSFRQWVFNPTESAVTNITVTETKYERK